jgi:hypothetical protein
MQITGNLLKMKTELDEPVRYSLRLGEEKVLLNEFLGNHITMVYERQINCVNCGRKTAKSFAQGFCFPCFKDSPENAECIIRPELCKGHLGEGRNVEWEQNNHVQPHIVYLALSSGVKVGVTRSTQMPTRWIDQGASKAMVLAETPNRYLAGAIEVAMKSYLTDKTNWQRMLKGEISAESLQEVKSILKEKFSEELAPYFSDHAALLEIKYPVIKYPAKVTSVSFDKLQEISGTLFGIKGQYLMFDDGRVINIRNHSGYLVTFKA